MTVEIVLLALASTLRPTSLAATYALLASASPRRLMVAYVAAGLTFTVLFGLVIVLAIGGIDIDPGSSRTTSTAQIAGGLLALGLAGLMWSGRLGGAGPTGDVPRAPGRWDRLLDEHLTLRTALVAGPATHLPGIFYLLALNVIATGEPSPGAQVLEVGLFNAIWFALPLVALIVCMVDPGLARKGIGVVNAWAHRHARMIVLVLLIGIGVGLVVRGVVQR